MLTNVWIIALCNCHLNQEKEKGYRQIYVCTDFCIYQCSDLCQDSLPLCGFGSFHFSLGAAKRLVGQEVFWVPSSPCFLVWECLGFSLDFGRQRCQVKASCWRFPQGSGCAFPLPPRRWHLISFLLLFSRFFVSQLVVVASLPVCPTWVITLGSSGPRCLQLFFCSFPSPLGLLWWVPGMSLVVLYTFQALRWSLHSFCVVILGLVHLSWPVFRFMILCSVCLLRSALEPFQ